MKSSSTSRIASDTYASTHPPIDLEAWERSISEEQLNLLKKHIAENASGYLEKLIFVLIGYSDLKEHSEPKGITLPLNFDEFLVDDLKLLARDRKFVDQQHRRGNDLIRPTRNSKHTAKRKNRPDDMT